MTNIFRCEGEYWTIAYGGATCHLRDTRGLQFLAALLDRPGQWLAAVELIARVTATAACHAPDDDRDPDESRNAVTAERARVRVTRAIKAAVRRLDRQLPSLAAHLTVTVRTGYRCGYLPDPRLPIVWSTEADADRCAPN